MARDELTEGGVMHAGRYGNFYMAAAGNHYLNMFNKLKMFYWRNRKVLDLRSHIILVAPPGFGKSHYIKQYMEMPYGILCKTGTQLVYQQSITAAGWVGTGSRGKDGKVHKDMGEAEEHPRAIFGCEEFKGLFTISTSAMTDALLATLDDGHLVKRVAAIRHDYQTYITMFSGTQIERLDLSSGLLRRLTTLVWIPTKKEENRLREIYFEGDRPYDEKRLKKIRWGINNRVKEAKTIRKINMSQRFKDWAFKKNIIPYELPIYERLIMGYNFMKHPPDPHGVLECPVDKQLFEMLKNEYEWRKLCKMNLPEVMVRRRIREHGEVKPSELVLELADLGMEIQKSGAIILDLIKRHIITRTDKGDLTLASTARRKAKE